MVFETWRGTGPPHNPTMSGWERMRQEVLAGPGRTFAWVGGRMSSWQIEHRKKQIYRVRLLPSLFWNNVLALMRMPWDEATENTCTSKTSKIRWCICFKFTEKLVQSSGFSELLLLISFYMPEILLIVSDSQRKISEQRDRQMRLHQEGNPGRSIKH